ncbi:MAG: hypothetical protein FWG97_03380 [Deltaproteobacteria bacterium]|nr:hypothetical protein [Deltaproteobacteria bacterium]
MRLDIPNMLLAGSMARNTGKTTFCLAFLDRWKDKFEVIGLKATNAGDGQGACRHGNDGCGACFSFAGNCEIIEETDNSGPKDTQKLLAAGAKKVFWIKARSGRLKEALNMVLPEISKDRLIVCESTSLAEIARPGVSVLMSKGGLTQVKPSAAAFMEKADFVADVSEPGRLGAVLDQIEVFKGGPGNGLRVSRLNNRFRSHGRAYPLK